jgi:hypothetical protein
MGEEFDMTIQEMGAIGELIGGIAIIISLLYVGLQIRQYSGALRSTTAQAAIQMAEATYAPILSNPDLAEISIRGLKDPAALTEVEMGRFNAQFHNVFFRCKTGFTSGVREIWTTGFGRDGKEYSLIYIPRKVLRTIGPIGGFISLMSSGTIWKKIYF